MTFRTLVELGGKTATGLRVPGDVVAALGSGRKPAVVVTIAGYNVEGAKTPETRQRRIDKAVAQLREGRI